MRKRLIVSIALFSIVVAVTAAPPPAPACYLVTDAELKSLLGGKIPPGRTTSDSETTHVCKGNTPKAAFELRLSKATSSGVPNVDGRGVKTFGPIICFMTFPPKGKESSGFSTTCSVTKNSQVGAIEVTVKQRADMIPIEKLKPIAEKIESRMP